MLIEQHFQLGGAVIDRARQQGDNKAFAGVVERAMRRVVNGTPSDRKKMMYAALPFMNDTKTASLVMESSPVRQFEELCGAKHLNNTVLLTGAVMVELGMTALDNVPGTPCPG